MKQCPTCGTVYDEAQRFCRNDGATLIEVTEPARDERLPRQEKQTVGTQQTGARRGTRNLPELICPKCGTGYSSAQRFCRYDGAALVPYHTQGGQDKEIRQGSAKTRTIILIAASAVLVLLLAFFALGVTGTLPFDVPFLTRIGEKIGFIELANEDEDMLAATETVPQESTAETETEYSSTLSREAAAELVRTAYGCYPRYVGKQGESFLFDCYTDGTSSSPYQRVSVDPNGTITIEEVYAAETDAPTESTQATEQPTEPERSAEAIDQISISTAKERVSAQASGATVGFAIQDLSSGALTGANEDDGQSASALVAIPVLYVAAKQIDDGTVSMNTWITLEYTGGRGKFTASDAGKSYTLRELLQTMLEYSDNNACNTLINYFGMASINNTCDRCGYHSVAIANLIAKTTDYTDQDNYVSTADLCGMLYEIYNDEFNRYGDGIGKSFLLSYMQIDDSSARSGLGKYIPGRYTFLNFNGVKDGKYNEIAIIDTGANVYAVAFLGNHGNSAELKNAAASLSEYICGCME